MSQASTSPALIMLVGSNPLPNFLSACALRPRALGLLFTSETECASRRLRSELHQVLGSFVQIEEQPILDSTSASSVQHAYAELCSKLARASQPHSELALNYTGGTKVMSAHARMAFSNNEGNPENASYLDEGAEHRCPRLRFDDGTSKYLSDYPYVPLDLRTVLALHGIRHEPRNHSMSRATIQDAREILFAVLDNLNLATALFAERKRLENYKRNPKYACSQPFQADAFGLKLSQMIVPTEHQLNGLSNSKQRKSWFRQWYEFIGGGWLEDWIGELIRSLALDPEPQITVDVESFRGEKEVQLQVDIAIIRAHRPYFISCTTDATKEICKSKLFEIAVRSQHLGGDLARAALVCLTDGKTTAALQDDIHDVWGATNTTRVFGYSDICRWSGLHGNQPDLSDLKQWFES